MYRATLTARWPLLLALFAYAVLCFCQGAHILYISGGGPVYALDDTYIQASMARNLVLQQSYGVRQGSSLQPRPHSETHLTLNP